MKKWAAVGKIIYSPRKKIILKALTQPMTPTQISKVTKIKLSNTSDTVRELVEMGLVDMLTPAEMRKGRIFIINKNGKEVLRSI